MSERAMVLCTHAHPWSPATHVPGTRVEHEATHQIGEQRDGYPGGDIITVECHNCGHRWDQELPQ